MTFAGGSAGIKDELRVAIGPAPAEVEEDDGGEGDDGDPREERRANGLSQLSKAFHCSGKRIWSRGPGRFIYGRSAADLGRRNRVALKSKATLA